jgi:hypothetical protein
METRYLKIANFEEAVANYGKGLMEATHGGTARWKTIRNYRLFTAS